MSGHGKQIAEAGLGIGAISLNPENPFQWASGYRMPIYNDNRMLLGEYKHRELVARALAEIIKSEDIEFDHVAGTATSGIAPAASVANLLDVPLVILDDVKGKRTPFVFENPPIIDILLDEGFIDSCAIASTCPWAIPYGVTIANELEMPFMYVRQSQKEHGLKQQVEGNPQFGQSVSLLDLHRNDSYRDNAVKALQSIVKDEEELGIHVVETISCDISKRVKPFDIRGKNIVVVEDLISTGGSSVGEVKAYRERGADTSHCISIFDYELGVAHEKFNEEGCEVRSALTYDVMLDTALKMGKITEEHKNLLREWRKDPFGWGKKHGFPKVEKK